MSFCPKILTYDAEVVELLELFSHYESGFLYQSGGIIDQPYYYALAMQRLKMEKVKWQKTSLSKQS